MINNQNINEIDPNTLSRKFNSLEFYCVAFGKLSDFRKMIELADELCLFRMHPSDTHDILQICKLR
jgi:hypothetical protein